MTHGTESALDGALAVALETRPIPVSSVFGTFLALRQEFGEDAVYLLESLAGPTRDCERALIGMDPLFMLEAFGAEIRVTGGSPVVDAVRRRIDARGTRTGRGSPSAFGIESGVWDTLRAVEGLFDVAQPAHDRPDFGFLLVMGYDAVRFIEDLPLLIPGPDGDPVPEIILRLYSTILDIDLRAGTATLVTSRSALWEPPDAERIAAVVAGAHDARPEPAAPARAGRAEAVLTTAQPDYEKRVGTALEHIRIGDIYQVQLGHEALLPGDQDDLAVYRTMRELNPSPFMAYLPLPNLTMLSASPELYLQISEGQAVMRPIAGTARRTGDAAEDTAAVDRLTKDEKEIAEHVMLVDLCRNDLGRVAVAGSVAVPVMMDVEQYSHVFHLVSTVTATVDDEFDVYDVIRATFPAGTMTGAPKIRAMEIIESLETSRRGMYAGAFGFTGLGGYANLALTIRTIVRQGDRVTTRASAGVVLDSTPVGEWRESLAKMNGAVVASTGQTLT